MDGGQGLGPGAGDDHVKAERPKVFFGDHGHQGLVLD